MGCTAEWLSPNVCPLPDLHSFFLISRESRCTTSVMVHKSKYLLLSSLISSSIALERARLVPQSLIPRANYEGSWALGIPGSECPSDTPVSCSQSSSTECCPSGNTCFGYSSPYCCPSSTTTSSVSIQCGLITRRYRGRLRNSSKELSNLFQHHMAIVRVQVNSVLLLLPTGPVWRDSYWGIWRDLPVQ